MISNDPLLRTKIITLKAAVINRVIIIDVPDV